MDWNIRRLASTAKGAAKGVRALRWPVPSLHKADKHRRDMDLRALDRNLQRWREPRIEPRHYLRLVPTLQEYGGCCREVAHVSSQITPSGREGALTLRVSTLRQIQEEARRNGS